MEEIVRSFAEVWQWVIRTFAASAWMIAAGLVLISNGATAQIGRPDKCFRSDALDQARARFRLQFERGQWEAVDDDAKKAMALSDLRLPMKALYAMQLAESGLQRSSFSQLDPDRVEGLLQEAEARARQAKDECLEVEVRFLYAQAHYWQALEGKRAWTEVRSELDSVIKTSEELHLVKHDLANELFYRGLIDQQQETGDLGQKYFEQSQEIALQDKDDFLVSFLERHLAVIDEKRGDVAGAEALYRRSLARREQLGATLYVPPAQAALAGLLQQRAPNNPEIMALYSAAAEGAARTKNNSMAAMIHSALRDQLSANGDREGALRHAEKALEFARIHGSPALIEETSTALRQIRSENTRTSAQQVITVPEDNHVVMVDGKLTPGEWDDAARFLLGDKAQVYVKQSRGYVWMAIEYLAGDNFTVDLYLQPGDGSLYDLHSSAKIGERKLQGQSWSDEWTWWSNDRWVANWSRVESFERRTFLPQKVREYQLSRARFTGNTWRVMFELMAPAEPRWQTFSFPEGAKNTSSDHWIVLRFNR